jgi:amidase
VGEINIAGLPGIAVPAGYYESGSPFGLIFVGRQWDEAALLGYAYAYENGTNHRKVPHLAT